MLRILIPVDFSEPSRTALRHARWLGQRLPVQVTLLYVAEAPMHNGAARASQLKLLQDRMERFGEPDPDDIWDMPTDVPIARHTVRFATRVPDEILAAIRATMPDLVVLGVRRKPTLWQQIFGSVSTALLRHTTAPLLIVPEKAPLKEIEKIGLAIDLHLKANRESQLLQKVARAWKAHIQPFAVQWFPRSMPEQRRLLTRKRAWMDATGVRHMDLFNTEEYERGIDAYLQVRPVEWLAIYTPGKRYLDKLFRHSILHGMPFKSQIPLLIFSE